MGELIPLPAGWGAAELFPLPAHCARFPATARSYDHTGRQLVWVPPPFSGARRVACDLEHGGRDCSLLAARFGVDEADFPAAWVATEVMAKLADVPILHWLATHGLVRPPAGARVEMKLPLAGEAGLASLLVIGHGGCTMAFGCLPSGPSAS